MMLTMKGEDFLLYRFFAVGSLLLCLGIQAYAQELDVGDSDIAYRRVFVPERELDQLDLKGFTRLPVQELRDLLHEYSLRSAKRSSDTSLGAITVSPLLESHYVARLEGQDLRSERSRLVVSKSLDFPDRITLRPWTIAINPRSLPGVAQLPAIDLLSRNEANSSNWIYDLQGSPRIPAFDPTDLDGGSYSPDESVSNEVVHWFGWSARSEANRQPNKLTFSFSIPKCADSFLLLALPPQAVVQESATVAVKLNEWSDIAPRLRGWSDVAKRSLVNFDPARAPDSLWLIELGATEQVSFSILLRNNQQTGIASENDAYRYSQLIKSQRLEHFLDDFEIRTTCDAEVILPYNQQHPLRLSLAPGSRLRRLTVNQQDVDWQMSDGWIQWYATRKEIADTGETLVERTGTATGTSQVKVTAEVVTPISLHSQELIETPRIEFDRGYVMAGSTLTSTSDTWQLSHVECESGRIVDALGISKSSKFTPVEYSWHAHPPVHRVSVSPVVRSQRSETLLRFTNDDEGTWVTARTKLFFLDQDSGRVNFQLFPGWSLVSARAIDNSDPATVRTVSKSLEKGEAYQLSWDRIQRGRVADWEFVFFQNATSLDAASSARSVSALPLAIEMPWKQENTIIVEDSGSFRSNIDEDLLEHLVVEPDSIPEWEQNLLPRSSSYYLLRGFNQEDGKKLSWIRVADKLLTKTSTLVHLAASDTISSTHQIEISRSRNSHSAVQVEYPHSHARWQLLEDDHWIALQPRNLGLRSGDPNSSLWILDLPTSETKSLVQVIVEEKVQNNEENIITLPRVVSAQAESIQARSDSPGLTISSTSGNGTWVVDENGYKTLELDSSRGNARLKAKIQPLARRDFAGFHLELDVLVDANGMQRAVVELNSSDSWDDALAVELDNGWTPIGASQRLDSAWVTLPYQMDGRRLLLSGLGSYSSQGNGISQEKPATIQIEFSGPPLTKSARTVLGFTLGHQWKFVWPQFSITQPVVSRQSRIWLPNALSILDSPKHVGYLHRAEAAQWPLRQWWASMFAVGRNSEISTSLQGQAVASHLLPKWISRHWHLGALLHPYAHEAGRNADPLVIVNGNSLYSLSICWMVAFALVTPRLIAMGRHIAAVLACVLMIISHADLWGLSAFAIPAVIGMILGSFAFALYRIVASQTTLDESVSANLSTRWTPWNDRNSNGHLEINAPTISPGGSARSATALGLFLIGILCSQYLSDNHGTRISQAALAQDSKLSLGQDLQVIIPMDEKGNLAGGDVYVSAELRRLLVAETTNQSNYEPGTYALSAKHILRLRSRGRTFAAADEILMAYEFMVGEDLSAVRFPTYRTQLQSVRFLVDGNEIALGSRTLRLDAKNEEWVWTPEKAGKRTVQLIGQPIIRTIIDSAKDASSPSSQQVEVSLLPVGNAVVEIDSDASVSLDIISRGRVIDPTPGKNLAMVGAIDRLQCKILNSSDASGIAGPVVLGNGEPPLLHTELFIQNETLQAKTIIDFPKNFAFSRRIEVEADQQWTPVGTQWGDAQWVEVLPGSTLSRRRYVLEWRQPITSTSSAAPRERQISVIWIPQSGAENLNIPFAECRDRRVRFGTLRYSPPGANWSIEGINTWIPAIGSKGRLDWPELSSNPIATTLRIPANGSFGILKPKPLADRQQARVTTKWTLEGERESIASRIELMSGNANPEPVTVDLPDSFSVSEIYNRNGPIPFLQHSFEGRNCIQLLADRKLLETSDLWIQARRELPREMESSRIPWLVFPTKYAIDQTLEIFASEQLGLRFDHTPGNVQLGKGMFQPVLSLVREASDIRNNATITSDYQVIRRQNPITGKMLLSSNSSTREFLIQVQINHNELDKPYFILQVPALLKDRWLSDGRIQSIACPDPNHAWIRVFMPNNSPYHFTLKFTQPSEVPFVELELLSKIKPINEDRISSFLLTQSELIQEASDQWSLVRGTVEEEIRQKFGLTSNSFIFESRKQFDANTQPIERTDRSNFQLQHAIHQVTDAGVRVPAHEPIIQLESRYLLQGTQVKGSSQTSLVALEWLVEKASAVQALEIDGMSVPFFQKDNRIWCEHVPTCNIVDVLLRSNYVHPVWVDGLLTLEVPQIQGFRDHQVKVLNPEVDLELRFEGRTLQPVSDSAFWEFASTRWMQAFYDALELIGDRAKDMESHSDLDRVLAHWNHQTFLFLQNWATHSTGSQNDSFGPYSAMWHEVQRKNSNSSWAAGLRRHGFEDLPVSNPSRYEKIQPDYSSASQARETWISLIAILAIIAGFDRFGSRMAVYWKDRPWWVLLAMGGLAWCITGSMIPALIMGIMGFIVMFDYYQLVNERLRRTGIHGQRSL